jgi:hypothetical protein
MLGQLQIDEPVIGMPVQGTVEIVREEPYDNYYGMVFRAA